LDPHENFMAALLLGIVFCAVSYAFYKFRGPLLFLLSATSFVDTPQQEDFTLTCPPPVPWFSVVCVAVACDVIVRLAWKGTKEWWRKRKI